MWYTIAAAWFFGRSESLSIALRLKTCVHKVRKQASAADFRLAALRTAPAVNSRQLPRVISVGGRGRIMIKLGCMREAETHSLEVEIRE
jgi:hypothetical protein